MTSAFTQIDLSSLPPPNMIEEIDYEVIRERYWTETLAKNPALTNAKPLEQSPANLIIGVQAFGEMLVRERVNAGVRAALAPFARGADLDAVVVRNGITRKVLVPASPANQTPAVMESDASLLRRYLLSFDGRSAGSRDRFLLEAYSALPIIHHASVNGWAVHGRRGEVQIIVAGPDGRDLTESEMKIVSGAVRASDVAPEAVAVYALPANRKTFQVHLKLLLPIGPEPSVVVKQTVVALQAALRTRLQIGSSIPVDYARGVAFSSNVIDVVDLAPYSFEGDPYSIPVCTSIQVDYEVVA